MFIMVSSSRFQVATRADGGLGHACWQKKNVPFSKNILCPSSQAIYVCWQSFQMHTCTFIPTLLCPLSTLRPRYTTRYTTIPRDTIHRPSFLDTPLLYHEFSRSAEELFVSGGLEEEEESSLLLSTSAMIE
jgi:hypothetical protein